MVTRFITTLLKVFVYYFLLFAICRLVFLLYFREDIATEGTSVFLLSLVRAFPLDLSTVCYLAFIPLILLWINSFTQRRIIDGIFKGYLFFTSLIIIVISISEIAVYREMHVKMYFNLLSHLLHPTELWDSISIGFFIILLIPFLLFSYGSLFVLKKLFPQQQHVSNVNRKNYLLSTALFFLVTGLLAVGCRGGLQPIPINEGEVYFSHNQFVNDATVNPLWSITHSYVENRLVLNGDVYKVMDDADAEKMVRELFKTEKDTTIHLFKVKKPNVCFLILESWSADVIASLGGYEHLTPNFEKLISEGYLFTNFKPAGHVSDQGIPAILSGYPALPIGSAINQPQRQVHLACINNEMKDAGYNSSFFFGGQLIYGNIKTYIYRNEFSEVIEQQNLPASLPTVRLGINDSLMLGIWKDSIEQMRAPFFTCLFTLSTHSPFDTPSPKVIDWGGYENPYLNSIAYADRQLGKFFADIKKQPWYNNTIFIIVADHSHGTPQHEDLSSAEFYHIPLLIYGGALKEEFRGVKNTRMASQTDIACTLLQQLNLLDSSYRWSKNLMNPYTHDFAFYTFNEGFGYVEDSAKVIWNKNAPKAIVNTAATKEQKDSLYQKGAAYLQVLMKDFLAK